MSIITHYDIVHNICKHLDDKSCVSFLLTCKESPLKQTIVKNIECGIQSVVHLHTDTERKCEKYSKITHTYEKRVIGYMISKAYYKRTRFAERFSRLPRFIGDDNFCAYYLDLYDTYWVLNSYFGVLDHIYPNIQIMFHHIEGIDKELSHPRCTTHILENDRESRIKALDDELNEYMAAR